MNATTYLQTNKGRENTVSKISHAVAEVSATAFFGMFAYATQSGLAAFSHKLRASFWDRTESRWLIGIDYGRSQPKALRELAKKANCKVKLYDGNWVSQSLGFIPRVDFHPKMAIISGSNPHRQAVVVGSGNFSESGLLRNIEAGAVLIQDSAPLDSIVESANKLWDNSVPLEDVIEDYECRWKSSSIVRNSDERIEVGGNVFTRSSTFWIEAGYVTKNRSLSPGNQVDLPRGAKNFFGFRQRVDTPNTTIGPVTFRSPIGETVTRNLRLGNNMMEKITLPTPEDHGFGMYDGKILVFRKSNAVIDLFALEQESFESVFGENFGVASAMISGRRFGLIE